MHTSIYKGRKHPNDSILDFNVTVDSTEWGEFVRLWPLQIVRSGHTAHLTHPHAHTWPWKEGIVDAAETGVGTSSVPDDVRIRNSFYKLIKQSLEKLQTDSTDFVTSLRCVGYVRGWYRIGAHKYHKLTTKPLSPGSFSKSAPDCESYQKINKRHAVTDVITSQPLLK